MRRVRLPQSWRTLASGLVVAGVLAADFGFTGVASLLGSAYPAGLMRGLLWIGGAGAAVILLRLALWRAERRGRLVFVTPADEAELMRDRQLKLPRDGGAPEPLRDRAREPSKEPRRPLWGTAKAAFAASLVCWGGALFGLAREALPAGAVVVLGGAGLALSLAALAAAFGGELLRAWRLLRADADD